MTVFKMLLTLSKNLYTYERMKKKIPHCKLAKDFEFRHPKMGLYSNMFFDTITSVLKILSSLKASTYFWFG